MILNHPALASQGLNTQQFGFCWVVSLFYLATLLIIWARKTITDQILTITFLSPIFKIPKLSLNMKSDQRLWNFFSVDIFKALKIHWKSTNKCLQDKLIYVDFTKLSLKYFAGRNFFSNFVFKDSFGLLNTREVITVVFPVLLFSWSNYRLKFVVSE